EVFILVVSRGKKGMFSDEKIDNVRREARNAHEVLGVSETRFLNYEAPELDLVSISDLSGSISGIINVFKPATMFLPHRGDIHHDHRAVFNAGLVASRPVNGNSVRRIFCYETLSETEWAPPFGDDAFIPDYFVNITMFFEYKLDAMNCYKSQLKSFPNPRSLKAIEALANLRGSTVGFKFAEAFMTIRVIED
ncbi:MAG: PIG-L family deacetylase, partial [Bacteroidales bacterium]|nr:PIG-L family deacetylase [Bacteroidales bacterium]